jgi:uncharacterized protein YgiM (DUF1202 family)
MTEKKRTRKPREVAEKPEKELLDKISAETGEAQEKPSSPPKKQGVVIPSLLNIRTGAGKEYPNLATLPRVKKGQEVEILGTFGDWYKVKVGENLGYAMSKYIGG